MLAVIDEGKTRREELPIFLYAPVGGNQRRIDLNRQGSSSSNSSGDGNDCC